MTTPITPDSPAVQSYLNILQGVITRMATNSANCKTWCITIVSAIVVAIADKAKPDYALIALIPVILFGLLDAYYLAQEKAFRTTYTIFVNKMHNGEAKPTDLFKVIPTQGKSILLLTLSSLTSFSVYPVYGTLGILIIVARFLMLSKS